MISMYNFTIEDSIKEEFLLALRNQLVLHLSDPDNRERALRLLRDQAFMQMIDYLDPDYEDCVKSYGEALRCFRVALSALKL